MTEPLAQILEGLYGAYNAGDARGAAVLYADDGRHEEIATGQVRQGRDKIAEGLERFFEAFPNAHWQPVTTIAEGPHAAATYVLTGTLVGDLGPFSGKGQALELAGVHVIRLDEGHEIEMCQDYWDAVTFSRQMSR